MYFSHKKMKLAIVVLKIIIITPPRVFTETPRGFTETPRGITEMPRVYTANRIWQLQWILIHLLLLARRDQFC